MFEKMLALAFFAGCIQMNASAAAIVELQATTGTGYLVSNGGKLVTLVGGPVPISMQLIGRVDDGGTGDRLMSTHGNIITSGTLLTGPSTAMNTQLTSLFKNNAFSNGKQQGITSLSDLIIQDDALGDQGRTGNATNVSGDTSTWAFSGGAAADYISAFQDLGLPVDGNQIIANVTLTPTGINNPSGTTSVQWYFRSGTANTSFVENGSNVAAKSYGGNILGGAPVVISIPEPGSISLFPLSVMSAVLGCRRSWQRGRIR